MIRLDSTTRKLQVVMDSSASASNGEVMVTFFDISLNGTQTRGATKLSAMSGATDVDICDAPTQNFIRNIDGITAFNKDTATHIITIKIDDAGAETILMKQSVTTLKTLAYEDKAGWYQI